MDRDRRPRDIPPEDQFGNGRGQSYRPGNARPRTPPRMDSYRARSPLPQRRSDFADSYRGPPRGRSRSPPLGPGRDDFRRRSPSPRFRDHEPRGGDSYRGPPVRREELPRDDLFRREPIRDARDAPRGFRDDVRDRGFSGPGRSPLPRFGRDRSPLPIRRARDPSPISSRGRRTPPPQRRDRLGSPPRSRFDDHPPPRGISTPRRRFSPEPRDRQFSPPRSAYKESRPRSRTPPIRNQRQESRFAEDRRRPISPVRDLRHGQLSREESAYNSATTSRRSSPPIHPSRMNLQQAAVEDKLPPARASPREPPAPPEAARAPPPEPRNTIEPQRRPRSPDPPSDMRGNDHIPPPREPRRMDDAIPVTPRAPPTGPAGQRSVSASVNPPTGPAAASSIRTPAAPPSGPRGATAIRGDFSGRGRGGYSADYTPRGRGGSFGLSYRGGRGGTPTGPGSGRRESSEAPQQEPPSFARGAAPPSGPRAAAIPSGPAQSYRHSASVTQTPFARTQRFGSTNDGPPDTNTPTGPPTGPKAQRRPTEPVINTTYSAVPRPHPALADLPQIIEGGKKLEPLVDRTKLLVLEEEAEKLRKQIEEKETRNRKSLREWERLTRDTEAAAFRSELAENALRQLNGEAELQAAF